MSELAISAVNKKDRVLAAALGVFGRYGYRRASMEDIAAEAGISRPALYLLFRNKRDIFRSAAADICARGADRVAEAMRGPGPFADHLMEALMARNAEPFRLISGLAHGEELLSMHGAIAGDIMADADRKVAGLVADGLRAAEARKEISLARAGLAPERLAELLLSGAAGLKLTAASPDGYEAALRELATLFLAALAPEKKAENVRRPLARR